MSESIVDSFFETTEVCGQPSSLSQGVTESFRNIELRKLYKVLNYRVVDTSYGPKCIVTLENIDTSEVGDRWCFGRLQKLFVDDELSLIPPEQAPYVISFKSRYPQGYLFGYKKRAEWESFIGKENVPPVVQVVTAGRSKRPGVELPPKKR